LFGFFWGIFGNFLVGFFGRIFLGGFFWEIFFGRIFLGGIFGMILLGGFFGRNYLVEINKELMFLSRFWGNFVSRQKEGRRENF